MNRIDIWIGICSTLPRVRGRGSIVVRVLKRDDIRRWKCSFEFRGWLVRGCGVVRVIGFGGGIGGGDDWYVGR